MIYQKKKYKLINNDSQTELELTNDPKNWDNSERTLKRSVKTFGVYIELSKDLVFVKEAAIFLREAYNFKDIEADVTLEEYVAHPNTERMYLHSIGSLDFSQYKSNKLEVKVPFKSGGLNTLIEAQMKERFEIERTEAINGNTINEVDKKLVALTSRKILLVSTLEGNSERGETYTSSGQLRTITMDVVANSDQENITFVTSEFIPWTLDGNFGSDDLNPSANQFFYTNSDVAKTIDIELSLDVTLDTLQGSFFDVWILQRDSDDNEVEFRKIKDTSYTVGVFDYTLDYSGSFDLSEGDSLMIVINALGNPAGSTQTTIVYNTPPKLTITEESEREDSQTYAVLMHEAYDKVMQIITGEQNRFYSEFYGRQELGYNQDGEFARTGLSLGFWIRQFFDKNMEISLDNLLTTSNTVHNTGYHIEKIGGVEKLIVEDLKYYFQDATTIKLPNQVSNVEREVDDSFYNSSLEFGYKKGGEYEEAMGLDEYNIKTGFTTPITRVDSKYSKLSDARADSYAKEFARRKPEENYPTTDTPYDKDLHLLDLKTGLGNALEERLWQDDFEQEPTGVFSPETATNLRLTPSQIEKRHRWFYGCGLTKHQDKKIRYSNTGGNNNLTTKKAGESARSEKDNINISDLERPRFVPQKITFEHPVDYFVNEQLNGKTNVNGRLIPNVYFKVEFINEYGQKEYGYLMEIKPNKEGKWTLLKAL